MLDGDKQFFLMFLFGAIAFFAIVAGIGWGLRYAFRNGLKWLRGRRLHAALSPFGFEYVGDVRRGTLRWLGRLTQAHDPADSRGLHLMRATIDGRIVGVLEHRDYDFVRRTWYMNMPTIETTAFIVGGARGTPDLAIVPQEQYKRALGHDLGAELPPPTVAFGEYYAVQSHDPAAGRAVPPAMIDFLLARPGWSVQFTGGDLVMARRKLRVPPRELPEFVAVAMKLAGTLASAEAAGAQAAPSPGATERRWVARSRPLTLQRAVMLGCGGFIAVILGLNVLGAGIAFVMHLVGGGDSVAVSPVVSSAQNLANVGADQRDQPVLPKIGRALNTVPAVQGEDDAFLGCATPPEIVKGGMHRVRPIIGNPDTVLVDVACQGPAQGEDGWRVMWAKAPSESFQVGDTDHRCELLDTLTGPVRLGFAKRLPYLPSTCRRLEIVALPRLFEGVDSWRVRHRAPYAGLTAQIEREAVVQPGLIVHDSSYTWGDLGLEPRLWTVAGVARDSVAGHVVALQAPDTATGCTRLTVVRTRLAPGPLFVEVLASRSWCQAGGGAAWTLRADGTLTDGTSLCVYDAREEKYMCTDA